MRKIDIRRHPMGRRRFDTARDSIPICICAHSTGSTCQVTAQCPDSDDSSARARRRAATAATGPLRARSAPHHEGTSGGVPHGASIRLARPWMGALFRRSRRG